MLAVFLLTAALAATPEIPVAAPEQQTSTQSAPAAQNLASAQEVVDLAYPINERQALFSGVVDQLVAQMRAAGGNAVNDLAMQAIIDKHVDMQLARLRRVIDAHIPEMIEGMVTAYAREFTLDELIQLKVFYSSPLGRTYHVRATRTLADPAVVQANRRYMVEVMAIAEEGREPLRREIMDYFDKHPEAARRALQSTKS